ncbi:helix-turn-helix transcriptional regulator [Arsukibacterium indicum]|uniref:Helix-turn-helix transcriptional regulator n=1 Tax=Arsukibacterium indicum TaxID=2848612 RepID=A0ABS6MLB6_9GAMM|nr:helix-turn-helix transcriptional regulator [Arsukibacterium indicum]MBV2129086.1 helix-turn-helix transcriptional regulator [Arsukibacterium indicum]
MPARSFSYQDKVLLLQHGSTELLALAQRRGALLHKLLSGTNIFEQDLHRPHGRLHHADWLKLLQNCQQQVSSPELPFLLGDALLNSSYISLCKSLQYARNLRQALTQLYYFRHQLFPGIFAKAYQTQQQLVIELHPALGFANQHTFMLATVFSLLVSLLKQQLGTLTGVTIRLQQDVPENLLQQQFYWGCTVSFNQYCDSLSIPLPLCYQTFTDADPVKFRAAKRTCLQLNRVLSPQRGLLECIYTLQQRALPVLLTQQHVADALGLSGSSLKRQLRQHHTNFANLIDQVRRDAARKVLQQGNCSNRQLAMMLGYSDEHNFRRAFKRWTGFIPSDYKSVFNFN